MRTPTEAYGDGREQGNPVLAAARNDALCRKAAAILNERRALGSAQLYEACGMGNSPPVPLLYISGRATRTTQVNQAARRWTG